jgi:biopolymer transport protein ExbD
VRLPPRARTGLEFNITPLIDVVFLLNIFFLVATYYIKNEQVEPVELPTASQGEEESDAAARLVLTVAKDGTLSIGGALVPRDDVINQLAAMQAEHPSGAEFRMRCDRAVTYDIVEPLLLGAAKHGVTRVRFSVLPE